MNTIIYHNYSFFKGIKHALFFTFAICMISSILTSCEIDDDIYNGGSTSTSSSQFVGTWTRQVQWAYTNGTREDTYVLKSGGTGTYKTWDWLDQRYITMSLTWTSFGSYVEINRKSTQDYESSVVEGYISSGGSAMKIGGYWYNKQ